MSLVGSPHSNASPSFDQAQNVANRSAGESIGIPTATAAPTEQRTAAATAAKPDATSQGNEDQSVYTSRTSFNTATCEWTLLIERHPPAAGVTVAEQKGFISQYSAMANSSTSLRNAFSMHI